MRLKLQVAYFGPAFEGWQSQAGGRAVQDVLEAAVSKIVGSKIRIHGAGRTDAGVHAEGQCCHFEISHTRHTPQDWIRALNANLPPELRVMRVARVPDTFHARFSSTGKIYRYQLWNAAVLPPSELQRAWHVWEKLDLQAMRSAAAILWGSHDFAGFSANCGTPVLDSTRTLRRIAIVRQGPRIRVTWEGNGFLYKMVRMLTSAMVECGRGRVDVGQLGAVLEGRTRWTKVAPPEGLTLVKVLYGTNPSHQVGTDLSAEDGMQQQEEPQT